jgi:hypothetical protein
MITTKTNIIIRFQMDGMHNFPKAAELFPEVAFLADRHRHMFHFELHKQVNHDDRDVEFICFKRDVMNYLTERYSDNYKRTLEFGAMSCEMIARELLEYFGCERVSVFEDGENGAEIYKTII